MYRYRGRRIHTSEDLPRLCDEPSTLTSLLSVKFESYYSDRKIQREPENDPVIVPQSAKCFNSKMVKHCALTNVNSDRGFES
jgi:hypothetical protein